MGQGQTAARVRQAGGRKLSGADLFCFAGRLSGEGRKGEPDAWQGRQPLAVHPPHQQRGAGRLLTRRGPLLPCTRMQTPSTCWTRAGPCRQGGPLLAYRRPLEQVLSCRPLEQVLSCRPPSWPAHTACGAASSERLIPRSAWLLCPGVAPTQAAHRHLRPQGLLLVLWTDLDLSDSFALGLEEALEGTMPGGLDGPCAGLTTASRTKGVEGLLGCGGLIGGRLRQPQPWLLGQKRRGCGRAMPGRRPGQRDAPCAWHWPGRP